MPKHAESKYLPYSAEKMYALVADIARYPEFLPWVMGARILERKPGALLADMIIGFKVFRETFRSRVTLVEPSHIHVDYVSGPLKYLRNEWHFANVPDGGCQVDFMVEFEFSNRLFETMVGALFSEAVRRMVGAFEGRAARLYGAPGVVSDINSSSATRTA